MALKKRNIIRHMILLFMLSLCIGTVSATIVTVGDHGKDHASISAAVTAAAPGDTILVSDGTYTENIVINKIGLTIISENGSASTVIRPLSPSGHLFQVTAGNVTIRGFNMIGSGYYERAGIYGTSVSNCNFSGNQFSANHYGVYLASSNNNTLTNNNVSYNYYAGAYLDSSGNNTFINNTANYNDYAGFFLTSSGDNTFTNNTVSSNYIGMQIGHLSDNAVLTDNTVHSSNYCGILLSSLSNTTLAGNTVDSNGYGISIQNSANSTLANNGMSSNDHNFEVSGPDLEHFLHDIDNTNLVDGKPLYYWVDRSDAAVPQDAGLVCVVNSTNITVRDLELSNGYDGVLFAYTSSSRIENVTASGNYFGVHLVSSTSNTLDNITANSNVRTGIRFESSGSNALTASTASDNDDKGIHISSSDNNIFTGNTADHNSAHGIYLESSGNSTLTGNTASNNDNSGIYLTSSNDNILAGNIAGSNSGCGIYVISSDNNTLSDNVANSNTGSIEIGSVAMEVPVSPVWMVSEYPYGIYIRSSGNSTLSTNTANYNTDTGIYLRDSVNILLTGNNVANNGIYGFYDYYSENTTVDDLAVTGNFARISFVTTASGTGIAGNDTSSVTLPGRANVSGYITIDSSTEGDLESKFLYDDSGMSLAGESSVALFRLNDTQWNEAGNASLNTVGNYVSVDLSGSGTFALFKDPESPGDDSSSGPGSSSGSGGGSAAAGERDQTIAYLPAGNGGEITGDTTVKSSAGTAALTFYKGTKAIGPDGVPVNRITVTTPSSLPSDTSPELIGSGLYYEFGPSGTIFSEEVLITINFDPVKFDDKVPVIYAYSSENGWVALETTVDRENGRATAMISHFSLYALSGKDAKAGQTVAETPEVNTELAAATEDEMQVYETPAKDENGSGSLYWIAGAGVVLMLGIVLVKR